MKATTLNDYRIPSRTIAEMMWGRGGTTAYRTKRHGAYYYSCSGHGGYVVDSRILTETERRDIEQYIKPEPIRLCVQHRQNGDVVIGQNLAYFSQSGRDKGVTYMAHLGSVEWVDLPVYLFEEDCAWSILERFTDIRSEGFTMTDRERQVSIERTFANWYGDKQSLVAS